MPGSGRCMCGVRGRASASGASLVVLLHTPTGYSESASAVFPCSSRGGLQTCRRAQSSPGCSPRASLRSRVPSLWPVYNETRVRSVVRQERTPPPRTRAPLRNHFPVASHSLLADLKPRLMGRLKLSHKAAAHSFTSQLQSHHGTSAGQPPTRHLQKNAQSLLGKVD